MLIRLNKFLSRAGVASRRAADQMIEEGRIKVNGRPVQGLGSRIDSEKDQVEVDGTVVKAEVPAFYMALNKPTGYLVTRKDPFQRPTVMQLIPGFKPGIFPVGRLDRNSEGLLLLTNDGELSNRLLHPKYKVKKVYRVKVKGLVESSRLNLLRKGIYLDGKKTTADKIVVLSQSPKSTVVQIEIHEGKKREIRRMFETFGYQVIVLKRLKFAGISLGGLKSGQWRQLSQKEIIGLKKRVGLED